MKKRGKTRKAQAWGMDLTIAIVIFSVGLVAFYVYALNEPSEAKENIESLFYDGNIITEIILSEGYPIDWNSGNVIKIGILSENKINETKLESFYNLAENDYAQTKTLFNTGFDYYFNLTETMTINSVEVEGIGLQPSDPQNLVKITRFTIYKNKPITAYLYIWE